MVVPGAAIGSAMSGFVPICKIDGATDWIDLAEGQEEYGEVVFAMHDAEVGPTSKPPVLAPAAMHYPDWSGPGSFTGHSGAHNVDISVTAECPGVSVQTGTAKTRSAGTMNSSMYFLCGFASASKNDENRVIVPHAPN